MATWFEPAALFIMFREALEAAVIIAVLLQLLNKLKMQHLKRQVWIGALAGVAISIVLGVIFIIVFYVAGNKIFTGNGELIFKGVVSWIASLMITVVALAMLKFYNLERKWRHKLESEIKKETNTRSHRWSLLLLAGSATLREGVESVLFLTGVSQGEGVRAIIIPGIVGTILGLLVGVLIFYSGKPIKSLKWFFFLSCGLLLLIASGLVVSGLGYFQAAGLFGVLFPYEDRPWANKILWDTSACCSSTDNEFWKIIKALFGYTDQPTNLQLLYYCLYWFIVIVLMVYKWWNGTLTDRRLAELPSMKSIATGISTGKLSDGSDDLESGGSGSPVKPGKQAGAALSEDADSAVSSTAGVPAAADEPRGGPRDSSDSVLAKV